MHKLLVTDGNAKGREIVIGAGEFLIGRLADDDNGRLADDLELSRRHARIMRTTDGGIEIEDSGRPTAPTSTISASRRAAGWLRVT